MLPRLAASVWQTTTGTIRSLRFTIRSSSRANGTKVIKATSLVISMLEKKHRRIRSCSSCLSEWIRSSSNSPSCRKKPMFWRPVVAVIRPKSRISVCRSRYPRYPADGGMINMERTARASSRAGERNTGRAEGGGTAERASDKGRGSCTDGFFRSTQAYDSGRNCRIDCKNVRAGSGIRNEVISSFRIKK